MRRRQFLIGAGALLAASVHAARPAWAQARSVRIGYLVPRKRSIALAPVLKRLGELGYVEGKNLVLEYRSSDGVPERFPALARELLDAKCDLIFAVGPPHSARALIDAKATVPIVIVAARILDGKAVPGEIPVEQRVEFEFAVNLSTAKELGIAIPESVLARADVVVE